MGKGSWLARAVVGIALTSTLAIGPAQAVAAAPGGASSTVASTGAAQAVAKLPMLRAMAAHGMMPRPGDITASHAVPAGHVSTNMQFLANLPITSAIAIAFIGKTAFVSTVLGLYSVDISDPANPQLLGALPMYIWENEHMQADPARNLVFIARDPRGFTTPATTAFPYGGTHIIDVSNPRAMTEVSFHLQPTGHTATCINNCRFLWIAGPASPKVAVAGGADPTWGGRPMWGLDISDPAHPVDCPRFIDLNNHDGKTDYDHDVDVDATGIAWISGSGHVRGYWTSGQHLNPVSGKVETATGCNPIPAGGGNTNEGLLTPQGGIIHNSFRNMSLGVDGRKGDLLAATEEVTVTNCARSGRFVTYDVGGSMAGQDWTNPPTRPYVLPRLDTWTPEGKPGSTGCDSSHWFTDRGDGLVAIAFYSQGTRVLDTRDPRHVKQVAYFNLTDASGGGIPNNAWAAYWHGDNYIFVADFQRGLDVLRYTGGVSAVDQRVAAPVKAPALVAQQGRAQLPDTSRAAAIGVGSAGGLLIAAAGVLVLLVIAGVALVLTVIRGPGRRRPGEG